MARGMPVAQRGDSLGPAAPAGWLSPFSVPAATGQALRDVRVAHGAPARALGLQVGQAQLVHPAADAMAGAGGQRAAHAHASGIQNSKMRILGTLGGGVAFRHICHLGSACE
eukprot:219733-Chlamydomonas_euryale.AAC.2